MSQSVADRFREIDEAFVEKIGPNKLKWILADVANDKFTLRQVADRNDVSCADVVQVCRYRRIDFNNNPTE